MTRQQQFIQINRRPVSELANAFCVLWGRLTAKEEWALTPEGREEAGRWLDKIVERFDLSPGELNSGHLRKTDGGQALEGACAPRAAISTKKP